MKKFLLLLFFNIFIEIAMAELIVPADSIRIVGYQYDFMPMKCEGRLNFLDHYFARDTADIDIEDYYVDYTIRDSLSIDSLLNLCSNLEVYDTLQCSTNELLLKNQYSIFTRFLSWYEPQCIDNRLLLIVFRKQNYELIWLSSLLLDKGYIRYSLSDNLKAYLSKYTRTFDIK